MSKPKAQVRKAKYVPQEYRDPTRDYQKEAETLMQEELLVQDP